MFKGSDKPASAEDLDKDMDKCILQYMLLDHFCTTYINLIYVDWIDAGKGENIVAALDREMDEYQKAAKTAEKPAV